MIKNPIEYPIQIIKVLGIGNGGANAAQYMIDFDVQGVEFICADTDAQAPSRSTGHHVIQIGHKAAEMAPTSIREAIAGTHVLFITTGIDRGTDTCAAPAIACVAREMGIFTIGLATTPVDIDGLKRMANADAYLAEFEQNVDSLIVAPYEKLMETVNGSVTPDKAFAHVFKNVVSGITNIASGACNPYIGVDFEDARIVLELPGKAGVGMGMASGPDRARIAAEFALACPLLEGMTLAEAQGVLIFISASQKSLKLSDMILAMRTIHTSVTADIHLIYSAACDDSLGDAIHVTVVVAGLR